MRSSKLSGRFWIFFIGIWLLSFYGINKAEGAEWKLFQATPMGHFYYFDSTNIKRFENDRVWVWVKIIETKGFTEKELKGLKDSKKVEEVLKKANERSTGEWKQLFEIICSARMARVLLATSYNTDGTVRDDYDSPSEWFYISPESVTHYLVKGLCP